MADGVVGWPEGAWLVSDFVGKGSIGERKEEREKKKIKKEKEKKEREKKWSGLFGLKTRIYTLIEFLNFQLRFCVILIVFSIFSNYGTSSSFLVNI